MLQQTQVERVKEYFERILKTFPTIESLAETNYEDFFPYYKWLGYYSRARNMLKAAQQVVNDFDGVFPDTTDELTLLPWIGPYTAEAIKAFAYNKATLSFDTNLEKIFSRYYFGNKFQKLSKEEKCQILGDFEKYYRTHPSPLLIREGAIAKLGWTSRDINNALMDYGAIISLNNIVNIDWSTYPLHSSKFYQTHGSLEPIKEKKKSSFPNRQAYIIAILHENHKVYFSCPMLFSPFLIWKNTWNPRKMIQMYFEENFWLEVSVRPPEVKSYKHETPYMICYTQIQSGEHDFEEFEWLKIRWFEEGYADGMEF